MTSETRVRSNNEGSEVNSDTTNNPVLPVPPRMDTRNGRAGQAYGSAVKFKTDKKNLIFKQNGDSSLGKLYARAFSEKEAERLLVCFSFRMVS